VNYKLEKIKIFTTPQVVTYHQFKVNMKCAKCLEIFAETNISNKHNPLRGFGSFNSPEDHKTPDTIITSQTDMSTIKKSMIDFSNINLIPGKT
jgi:hypothetical protein